MHLVVQQRVCISRKAMDNKPSSPVSLTFKCHLCYFEFFSISGLARHLVSHVNECVFSCCLCGFQTTTASVQRRHYKTCVARKVIIKYLCSYCNFDTDNKEKFQKHLKIHTDGKPVYYCATCKKHFFEKKSFVFHEKLHNDPTNALKCEQCAYTTFNKYSMSKHKFTHLGVNRPRPCKFCNHVSTSYTEWKLHVAIHTKTNVYNCSFCGYRNVNKSHFIRHSKRHAPKFSLSSFSSLNSLTR